MSSPILQEMGGRSFFGAVPRFRTTVTVGSLQEKQRKFLETVELQIGLKDWQHVRMEVPSGNLLHSYWKWSFIVSFLIKNGDFPMALLNYQRVTAHGPQSPVASTAKAQGTA